MEKLRHQYPVGALAEALEVSKSGFHARRNKPRRPRRQRDAQLRPLIAQSFARSRKTYGPLRVRADLRELGERCGKTPGQHDSHFGRFSPIAVLILLTTSVRKK